MKHILADIAAAAFRAFHPHHSMINGMIPIRLELDTWRIGIGGDRRRAARAALAKPTDVGAGA
jgi:hypothetical protein